MHWNPVPTTCTAMQCTGWDYPSLANPDELTRTKYALARVDELIRLGFYQDFALLFIIVTNEQQTKYNLKWFFEKIGFQETFTGEKSVKGQRHKETGALHMWCASPPVYKESVEAFKKELTDRINILDRRRISPERQKFPDSRIKVLKDAGLIQKNAKVDNPFNQILTKDTTVEALSFFIRKNFGINVEETFGKDWTKVSYRQVKEAQARWKVELVPY